MRFPLHRILIIRFSSLGDIVLTTPVLSNLKRSMPQTEIGYVLKAGYLDILKHDPRISYFFPLSNKQSLWGLARDIRQWRPDIVIDLHANLRSYLLSFLVGGKMIRYDKQRDQRRALVKEKRPRSEPTHTIDLYLKTLTRIGVPIGDRNPKLIVDDPDPIVEEFMRHAGGKKLIGINPGARHHTKKWVYFPQLVERLSKNPDYAVILFGSVEDRESLIADHIFMREKNCIDTMGRLDLSQLATLIRRCDLFVTNDTGPMHIAAATGTKVVAIFGGTVPELGFWPYGERHRIIETPSLKCRPCHLHGQTQCPLDHFHCMKNISVDRVYHTVIETIEQLED
ncbi:MAG: hypothetical protein B6244_06530 [Candidatus Cloacimonetes bacterium 4572_55]|nr:MAG: hypothetical protein B6244_06530 [Candidatus Cloacimonetes bacterium 4572_55]